MDFLFRKYTSKNIKFKTNTCNLNRMLYIVQFAGKPPPGQVSLFVRYAQEPVRAHSGSQTCTRAGKKNNQSGILNNRVTADQKKCRTSFPDQGPDQTAQKNAFLHPRRRSRHGAQFQSSGKTTPQEGSFSAVLREGNRIRSQIIRDARRGDKKQLSLCGTVRQTA